MNTRKLFLKIIKINILVILILCGASVFLNSLYAQNSNWHPPSSADLMKPSIDMKDAKVIKAGDQLYHQLCAICHGDKGKGDGVAGMVLKPKPNNFTLKKFQEQSNGAIYWKMTEGNPPMASYKSTLTNEQRWELVAYIRTLGQK